MKGQTMFLGCVFLCLIAVFGLLIVGYVTEHKNNEAAKYEIQRMAYDVGDVEIFLKTIGGSFTDFMKSQSLRNQYEVFRNGGTTEFIQASMDNRKQNRAESSAQARGMATGLAVGMVMNQNN